MASMAVYLRSRPRSFLRASAPVYSSSSRSHFSTSSSSSSSPDPRDENPQNTENNQSNSRSSLNDVRSRLQGRDWKPSHQPPRQGFSFSQGARPLRNKSPSTVDIMEIRKNLSEFGRRSDAPSRPPGVNESQGQAPLSFRELYKKMSENANQTSGSADKESSPRLALDAISKRLQRPSVSDELKRVRPASFSLSKFKETLNSKPTEGSSSNATGSTAIGGTSDSLPYSVFGKELREKKTKKEEDDNVLVKDYSKNELGEKLRQLRPDGLKQGNDWFSFSELNERLIKLKELDQEEKTPSGANFAALRRTLELVQDNQNDKMKFSQRLGIVGQLGATPTYMLAPPKENLVEKYFHPDNMSSAEKLKLELKAVRDEFKMSETDCGSPRVQIAQLTTEISHLSKVLHKKDKHSKKGLLAKVQLRKKLLKYLRRTDWDSYCFILSKLGLRDNPGYKQ